MKKTTKLDAIKSSNKSINTWKSLKSVKILTDRLEL